MMKILPVAFFCFLFAYGFSQAPPIADSIAKKFKISRVTRVIKYPYRQNATTYNDYYDKTGKLIKSVKIDGYNKEKNITSNEYHNGLLTNEVFKNYCEGKLCETQNTVNTYNKEKRLTGSTTISNENRIVKDTIIYNDAMNIDTIHSYSNDTSVYNTEKRSYDIRLTKNLHELQVTINYYDPAKIKVKQIEYSYDKREGCLHSHRPPPVTDSTGYTITEWYVSGDTAIQKVKSWTCQESTSLYKSIKISPGETYSYNTSNGYGGDTTRTVDKFNKLNLISIRNITTIQKGYKDPSLIVITYQYFYDQER